MCLEFKSFFYLLFYWGIVVLQYCVSFYCTAKWSSLCYTAVSYQLSILCILVYICQSQSPNSSHPSSPRFPPLVSICLSSTSVSLFLPYKLVHLYHFSRFHIYALIYDICFSVSDLRHSVWQSLGPSMCLQMTQFRSFLWLSNIPLYICTTSKVFPGTQFINFNN